MRKHATTLIAPLAALAIAGTVTAPAYANGDHGHRGDGDAPAAEITTSEEATAALEEAGVSIDAVEPATAEPQDDGTVELTFPKASSGEHERGSGWSEEIAFAGGIAWGSEAASANWADPTVDTEDGQISFDIDGQRVDALQVVSSEDDEGEHGDQGDQDDHGDEGDEPREHWRAQHGDRGDHGDELDLALTAEGAEALNAVAGDGTFAEGDVLAETDDGHDC